MRDYLIGLRKQQNESQQDVADSIGISRQYYAMIEAGDRQKKMDTTLLVGLARHFKEEPEKILEMESAYKHQSAIGA